MANQSNDKSGSKTTSPTVRILLSPFALATVLLISMLISILLELIGMLFWGKGTYWWWKGAGSMHSALILKSEIAHLTGDMNRGIAHLPSLSKVGVSISDQLYYYLFRWTGIESVLVDLASYAKTTFVWLGEAIMATINTIQIFIVRLTILILAIPLFLIFSIWGFTEGLIRRDLRRFGGDIERGYRFHQIKRYAGLFFTIPVVLYLALPFPIHPGFIFPAMALTFSLLIMSLSATFIKQI